MTNLLLKISKYLYDLNYFLIGLTNRSQSLLLESDTHLLLVKKHPLSKLGISGIWLASCSFLNERKSSKIENLISRRIGRSHI